MPVPDYETMMRPVLVAFDGGVEKVADLLPALKAAFAISDEEAEALIPSGRISILASRAHWARTYLSKAGLLTSPKRNHHIITDKGRAYLARHPDRIDNSVLKEDSAFEAWRTSARETVDTTETAQPTPVMSNLTPDDQIRTAFDTIESALREDLLSAVIALTPARFEDLIVDLLVAMGYGGGDQQMGSSIGKSGDGGIDGIINEDKLGLDAVYIQAKRYAVDNKVGRPALQGFVGSLTGEGANKGVFVTTSDFSREAVAYVERVQHRIVLINGDRLARLMIAHNVGVRVRQTYLVRSVDEDYFSDL
jgi:restriction system protein